LFGVINWVSRWYRRDGKLTSEQILGDIIEIGLNAVLTDAARVSAQEMPMAAALPRNRAAR
jgi:hypothetical protein